MPDKQRILGRLDGDELFGWALLMTERRLLESRITAAAKTSLLKRGYALDDTSITYEGYFVVSDEDDEEASSSFDGTAFLSGIGKSSRDDTGPTEP